MGQIQRTDGFPSFDDPSDIWNAGRIDLPQSRSLKKHVVVLSGDHLPMPQTVTKWMIGPH